MKSYAAFAALIAAVMADVKLTNSNFNLVPGESFEITWAEAQGPVTIELLTGKSTDLKPVAVLTSDAAGNSYTWTVPADLDPALYAFSISDGVSPINYSMQFPIGDVPDTTPTPEPSTTAAPTTTKETTKTSLSAQAEETTSSFEIQSSSSTSSSASKTTSVESSSSTLSTSTTASTTKTSSTPSTVATPPDGEGKAPGMASPLALILVSVAAMFYLQ